VRRVRVGGDRLTRRLLTIAAIAVVYFVTARLGLALDAVRGFATLVWPPTGIALAALLLIGHRAWPGVALGAFAANLSIGASPLLALGIASGNTLEALAGAWALRRIPGFRPQLDRLRDVAGLIVLAAGLTTVISASVGVFSLYLAGKVTTAQVPLTWRAWWLGDLVGDLIVAPLVLVWVTTPPPRLRPARILEALTLSAALATAGLLMVWSAHGVSYLLFPPLVWAATRFGLRGAVTASLLASAIAVAATASGHGPFAGPVLHESLYALQAFMAVAAGTILVLGASIAERSRLFRELEQAVQARDTFVSVASHELRNPLTPLQLTLEWLKKTLKGKSTDEVTVGRVEVALRQVQRLITLLEDMLDVTRVATRGLSLRPEPLDLGVTVREVSARFQEEAERVGSELIVRTVDARLRADPMRIEQVVTNLLSNALKFGEHRPIDVVVEVDGPTARFSVRDRGIGIAPDDLDRIFARYERAVSADNYGGLGIGLYVTRQIVEAHGGHIRVESTPGQGSRFVVDLPLVLSS
jgi:signal transduction histidine kinase